MNAVKLAEIIGFVVFAYLLGSLPFGFWIGKIRKGGAFDIRNFGSGSIGFTNVLRVLGLATAIPVFLADAFKGYLPVFAALHMYFLPAWVGQLCLVFVMLGHAYSLYFWITEKHPGGGKSVASALGGILALNPIVAGLSLLCFVVVLLTLRWMSVASMVGGLATLIVSHYVLHLGPEWDVFFGLVAGLIIFLHRRNLGRLFHRTEPKLFEWTSLVAKIQRQIRRWTGNSSLEDFEEIEEEVLCAFMVHALSWHDLLQTVLCWWLVWMFKWEWTSQVAMSILSLMPVLENAEVTGIKIKNGPRVRILVLAIPFLSHMIDMVKWAEEINAGRMKIGDEEGQVTLTDYRLGECWRKRLLARCKSGIVQSRRQGAEVVGMGALLSTRFNGAADLQKWADERNLDIMVENGAAFTSVTNVKAAESESPIPLAKAKVSILGASGFIGRITGKLLEKLCAQVVAIGRDRNKLDGFDEHTIVSTQLADAYDSDIIVLVTNSTVPLITPENCINFKTGAVFIDTATPYNFDDKVLKEHPEKQFKLVRCGPVSLPHLPGERIMSGVDWHFGYDEDGNPKVPACVAQTIMDAINKKEAAAHVSRGARIREADFEYYLVRYEGYGMVIEPSQIGEGHLFANGGQATETA